jgi:hypothetical protein
LTPRSQQADDGRQGHQVDRGGSGTVLEVNAQDIAKRVKCEHFGEAGKKPRVGMSALDDIKPEDLGSSSIGTRHQSGRRRVDTDGDVKNEVVACVF